MDSLPQDPFMLLSFVNTQLRDSYSSLDDFCLSFGTSRPWLEQKLSDAGFVYNPEQNKFW